MPLRRRRDAFDHPEWIFELKYDGFRALAVIQPGRAQLIVRCPYCVLADDFRPMLERPGWFICQQCGHTILRHDPDFKCRCQNCEASWAA
jgi:hypothetical protein